MGPDGVLDDAGTRNAVKAGRLVVMGLGARHSAEASGLPILATLRRRSVLRADYLTVRRLSADNLPVRRSVTISKDTFCPSLRFCIAARSTALMCTKTS